MKRCGSCGRSKPLAEFRMRLVARRGGRVRQAHSYCRPCEYRSVYATPSHRPKLRCPIWVRDCAICGTTFVARLAWTKTCSGECSAELRRRKDAASSAARYAGESASAAFPPQEIFDRDGWRCHICLGPVAKGEATLDHLVPVVDGGPHTRENVATAHLRCNSRRGAGRLIPAQLRLVG